jgi:hypothetical protein
MFVFIILMLILMHLYRIRRQKRPGLYQLDCSRINLGNCLSIICHSSILHALRVSGCPLLSEENFVPRQAIDFEDQTVIEQDVSEFGNLGSMIHENRPWFALQLAEALRQSLVTSTIPPPSKSRTDGIAVIYLRCSDVPHIDNDLYELIEYDWYLRALALLPSAVRRGIEIRQCMQHPDVALSEKQTYVCYAYASGLKDVLTRAGFKCKMESTCRSPQEDFMFLSSSAALLVGGCGGSFGFWAGALAPAETHVVLPSPRTPRFMELGTPASIQRGRKTILRAERVRNQTLRSQGIRLDHTPRIIGLCNSTRLPIWPLYDGRAYYINRVQDTSRKEHMERELALHGFRATRVEPSPASNPVTSLTMTHLRILELISAERKGWTAVFEDDVTFHGTDVLDEIREIVASANMFAYMGLCFRCQDNGGSYKRGRCAHAYLVCPEGASYLAWIINDNEYVHRGEHIDVVLERHVKAPLLRGDLKGVIEGHNGIAFQDRNAPWYKGSTTLQDFIGA